jgi:hypothetical protein
MNIPHKKKPDVRHIVLYPPTITQGAVNIFFAVYGPLLIEVPEGTTLTDVQELFCWGKEARQHWDKDYSEAPIRTIEVKGSKGNTYKVTNNGTKWKCECRGFQFRQDCKHIQSLKIILEG